MKVVTVGRLVPKKGHDLLVSACATIARDRAVHLTLVGDGPERVALHRHVRAALARSPRLTVELLGALPSEDVLEMLLRGRHHVFALACRVSEDGDRDGLPVALLEAAAAGLPIVSSALPGFDFEFGNVSGARLVPMRARGACLEPESGALHRAIADVGAASADEWRAASQSVRQAAARRPSPAQTAVRLLRRLRRPLGPHVHSGAPGARGRVEEN